MWNSSGLRKKFIHKKYSIVGYKIFTFNRNYDKIKIKEFVPIKREQSDYEDTKKKREKQTNQSGSLFCPSEATANHRNCTESSESFIVKQCEIANSLTIHGILITEHRSAVNIIAECPIHVETLQSSFSNL